MYLSLSCDWWHLDRSLTQQVCHSFQFQQRHYSLKQDLDRGNADLLRLVCKPRYLQDVQRQTAAFIYASHWRYLERGARKKHLPRHEFSCNLSIRGVTNLSRHPPKLKYTFPEHFFSSLHDYRPNIVMTHYFAILHLGILQLRKTFSTLELLWVNLRIFRLAIDLINTEDLSQLLYLLQYLLKTC
jgi:hypothetical protein